MSILKKLKSNPSSPKKTTLGDVAQKIIVIDDLKKKGLLRTTDYGVFYTFPEVIKTDSAIKNLYIYARLTKLIEPGKELLIHHIETNELLAKYS